MVQNTHKINTENLELIGKHTQLGKRLWQANKLTKQLCNYYGQRDIYL